MGEFLPLAALGPRIMICGPSNSGKSTLAVAMASKLGAEAFHVDLFRHLPDTNWVQRPRRGVRGAARRGNRRRALGDGRQLLAADAAAVRARHRHHHARRRPLGQLPALRVADAVPEAQPRRLAGRRQGQHQVGDGALDPAGAASRNETRAAPGYRAALREPTRDCRCVGSCELDAPSCTRALRTLGVLTRSRRPRRLLRHRLAPTSPSRRWRFRRWRGWRRWRR